MLHHVLQDPSSELWADWHVLVDLFCKVHYADDSWWSSWVAEGIWYLAGSGPCSRYTKYHGPSESSHFVKEFKEPGLWVNEISGWMNNKKLLKYTDVIILLLLAQIFPNTHHVKRHDPEVLHYSQTMHTDSSTDIDGISYITDSNG